MFALARELGKTVRELEEGMDSLEFEEWAEFFRREEEARKKAEEKARKGR